MKIYIIQFSNNFYNVMTAEGNPPLGEYCVFGHFDALNILTREFKTADKESIWELTAESFMSTMDVMCTKRNLLCFTDDDKKDEAFRGILEQFPVLMISLIRLNGKCGWDEFQKRSHEYNKKDNMMIFCTNAHSEIVSMVCGNSFSICKNAVLELQNQLDVLKMYTIFAVKERHLQDDRVAEENVDCRLRMMVKDRRKAGQFLNDLEKKLGVKGRRYEILGESDFLVEYDELSIHRLLPLYKMGEMMTHPFYKDIFYNVETEIVKGREQNG